MIIKILSVYNSYVVSALFMFCPYGLFLYFILFLWCLIEHCVIRIYDQKQYFAYEWGFIHTRNFISFEILFYSTCYCMYCSQILYIGMQACLIVGLLLWPL